MIVDEKPGLPPPAAPGRFIGFTAEGDVFSLRWNPGPDGNWFGIGFEEGAPDRGFQPLACWGEDLEQLIKSHAELPMGRQ